MNNISSLHRNTNSSVIDNQELKYTILQNYILLSLIAFCALKILKQIKKINLDNKIKNWIFTLPENEKSQGVIAAYLIRSSFIRSSTNLKIKDVYLRQLPLFLFDLVRLQHLEIEYTNIKTLPPEIKKLGNLLTLSLDNNQLKTIPQEIKHLKNLFLLSVKGNIIKKLGFSLKSLKNLKVLDLSYNYLSSIPKEISEFPQLEVLRISHNKIKKLSESIFLMKSLIILKADDNFFTSLPKQAFQGNLSMLTLSNNRISRLPDNIPLNNRIEVLDIKSNQLKLLPISIGNFSHLRMLNLNNNRLTHIPSSIGYLKNLQTLDLGNNRSLQDLPLSCVRLSSLEIFNVFSTPINQRNFDTILEGIAMNRTANINFTLDMKLQVWASYADTKKPELPPLSKHEIAEIQEWLLRLEMTNQFQGKNKQMAQVVINILSHLPHKQFKEAFFNQLAGALTDCEDKALMTVILINLQLHLLTSNKLLESEHINILIKAAKTLYLLDLIGKEVIYKKIEKESTQIYLYFLLKKHEELGLLLPWNDFEMHYLEFTKKILTKQEHNIFDKVTIKLQKTDTSLILLKYAEEATFIFMKNHLSFELQNLEKFCEIQLEEIESSQHTNDEYEIKINELTKKREQKLIDILHVYFQPETPTS